MLGVSLFTTSCNEDFLENNIKSRLTDDMQWASEGNADLFLNDIYAALSNKWNSPDNLDNFTDDNDAGFYWKSYSWRQGIVDPGGEQRHAHGPRQWQCHRLCVMGGGIS